MSFWKRIFRRKRTDGVSGGMEENVENTIPVFHREKISMHNRQEREQYIRSILEQIADAERQLHHLDYEYDMVTSHLTDIEELERAPEVMRLEIREMAEKLSALEEEQTGYTRKKYKTAGKREGWTK